MIPKLHAKGSSFKGAAAYLLHDKDGAATSGRVAWVETVNLVTRNPETAWRVMAATAIDANRLKAQAGVKKSGRQSKDAVLHLTLSWSPEQKPGREEMSAFARRALQALKAEDRQAMIICHTDEKHPHLHILLNRVSPTDGRMLSSSNEKLALSALALAYEKEGGKVYCEERVQNAAKREKGEHARGSKDISRPEFEALREALAEALQAIPAQLARQSAQIDLLRVKTKAQLRKRLAAIKDQLRPDWRALYERQRTETVKAREQKASFIVQLRSLIGRHKAGSPALPFRRQSGAPLSWNDRSQPHKQRQERARLAQNYRSDVRKAVGEIRTACQLAVRQLFVSHDRGSPAREFAPAASGIAPQPQQTTEQTAAPRRLTQLAEKFRKDGISRQPEPKPPTPGKPRDKDRDREPEF